MTELATITELGPLYKFTAPGGVAPMAAGYRYPLPRDGKPGEWTDPVAGELEMCENGYHLSRRNDVAWWLNAEMWEAEGRGDFLTQDGFEGKASCRSVRLVRRIEVWNDRVARLFACDCAEHVLPLFEENRPGDDRPRTAIAVARRYADGKATREELAAARDAACAAWTAARGAAWTAARDAACAAWTAACAARAAAWAAARAAAWAAARAAAWAARDAAYAAARDAAWDAERGWQTGRLWALLEAS